MTHTLKMAPVTFLLVSLVVCLSSKTNALPAKAILLPIDVALPRITASLIDASIHASREEFPQDRLSSFYDGGDWGWLRQKMLDTCPVLSREKLDVHLTMLARLCLEEQLVDRNGSTGSGGNYGSKYHPRENIGGEGDEDSGQSIGGTRPLTRGELTANWPDILDVLITKYEMTHEREQNIRELVNKHSLPLPALSAVSLSSSLTLKSISSSPCYVYVHCPEGFKSLGSPVMDVLLSNCDVVEGGELGDAMEYMVADVLGEEGADAMISYHCFSRDMRELESVVKDERTFPSKFWFVCNSRLEPEKSKAISNPFVTQVDHAFVQSFLRTESDKMP